MKALGLNVGSFKHFTETMDTLDVSMRGFQTDDGWHEPECLDHRIASSVLVTRATP